METIEEQVEELPTHYWVRGKDNNMQGEWRIERVSDLNIHYIQDPESFGYEVIVVPKGPQERDRIAEDRGRLFELEGLNNWFLYTMEFEPDVLKEWEAMYEREKQKIKEALTTPLQDNK